MCTVLSRHRVQIPIVSYPFTSSRDRTSLLVSFAGTCAGHPLSVINGPGCNQWALHIPVLTLSHPSSNPSDRPSP